MSAIFDYTGHKELWNWLAENPGKDKHEWPGWKAYHNGRFVESCCYACVYDTVKGAEEGCLDCCKYCPLEWPGNLACGEKHSLYEEWGNANAENYYETASNLARKIANLPVKAGVETK